MSIIVRGMEMPENCAVCEFHGRMDDPMVAQHWCKKTGENILTPYKGRGKDCPLGNVPTPHGRLIDADALGSFPYNMDFCDGGEADEWIQNAPTIIEAEDGE